MFLKKKGDGQVKEELEMTKIYYQELRYSFNFKSQEFLGFLSLFTYHLSRSLFLPCSQRILMNIKLLNKMAQRCIIDILENFYLPHVPKFIPHIIFTCMLPNFALTLHTFVGGVFLQINSV